MGGSTAATVVDLPPVSIESDDQGIKLVLGESSELGKPLLIVFQHLVVRMFLDFWILVKL